MKYESAAAQVCDLYMGGEGLGKGVANTAFKEGEPFGMADHVPQTSFAAVQQAA